SSRRRHTRFSRDWSSDVCSSDLPMPYNSARRSKRSEVDCGSLLMWRTESLSNGTTFVRRQGFRSLTRQAETGTNIQRRIRIHQQIGRASCREREEKSVGEVSREA